MIQKVLYIGGFDLPDGNAAAQRVVANSLLFSSLGCDVLLLGRTENKQFLERPFEYQGLACYNYQRPTSLGGWIQTVSSISQYVRFIDNFNPDCVIAYDFPSIALLRLKRFCNKRGIVIIADCAEWHKAMGSGWFNVVKDLDTAFRMRFVHKTLDGLIVISQYLEHYYSGSVKNILNLPPLVDKNDPKWDAATRDKPRYEEQRSLIYAGTASKKDRLDIIINSLGKVQLESGISFRFDIVGSTEKRFRTIYPGFKDIPSNVFFWGRIEHMRVLSMLAGHDFQIFIREKTRSNMAGFPTKYVEAVSSGVLVIANDISDLREYLIDGDNGYVLDLENETTLTDQLIRILSMPSSSIIQMKSRIDKNMFDYRQYSSKTRIFLERL